MASKNRHLVHLHSAVQDKEVSTDLIKYGELAVVYNAGNENIQIKNTNDEIAKLDRVLDIYKRGYNSATSFVGLPTDKLHIYVSMENEEENISFDTNYSTAIYRYGDLQIIAENPTKEEHTFHLNDSILSFDGYDFDFPRWGIYQIDLTTFDNILVATVNYTEKQCNLVYWTGGTSVTYKYNSFSNSGDGIIATDTTGEIEIDEEITSLRQFLTGQTSLTSVVFDHFDTSNISTIEGLFNGCTYLTSADLSSLSFENPVKCGWLFFNCARIPSVDISFLSSVTVTTFNSTFSGCYALTGITGLDTLDSSNFDSLYQTFWGCNGLTDASGVEGWNTSNVESLEGTFHSCYKLTSLDLSNWDTSKVTTLNHTFTSCSGLTSLTLSNWDVSNVTTMEQTFFNCRGLTSLDLSGWDTSSLTNVSGMCQGCSYLTSIDMSEWDMTNVTSYWNVNMFQGCSSLTSVKVTNCDSSTITKLISALTYTTNRTFSQSGEYLVSST